MWRPARSSSRESAADRRLRQAQLAPLIAFRAGLVTVCSLLTVVPVLRPDAAAVLLALALGTTLTYLRPRLLPAWSVLSGIGAAAAVPLTGASQSPLLPYLLATGLTCALLYDGRRLLVETGLLAGLLLAGMTWSPVDRVEAYVIAAAEWVLLTLTVGTVTLWARHHAADPVRQGDYDTVRHLLQQLRSRARQLPGALDATSAAEELLVRCAGVCPHDRSAVLVLTHTGAFSPLAVRGAPRVPWRGPEDGGVLRDAWHSGRLAVDRRLADLEGPRQGSALLAVPLQSAGERIGLLVLESPDPEAFSTEQAQALQGLAAEAAPRLETALLFEEVREAASHEERGRLARQMHDGIAQELAFFGYELDDLRNRAAGDPAVAQRVGEIRAGVTQLLSDLRLSITDLRTTMRTDRGLAEAMGGYLRAVCSGRDVRLELSLQETAFRLPGDLEVALLRVVQSFAQEARKAERLTMLSAELVVDAPSALLRLSADCAHFVPALGEIGDFLTAAGARVQRCGPQDARPWVEVVLEGDSNQLRGDSHDDSDRARPLPPGPATPSHDGPAGGRPRADQAGAAPRVRAD